MSSSRDLLSGAIRSLKGCLAKKSPHLFRLHTKPGVHRPRRGEELRNYLIYIPLQPEKGQAANLHTE